MHLREAVWPALFLAVALAGPAAEPAAGPDGLIVRTNVFVSGQGGYHTYRIPSLGVTARGTLLAFAEGRKGGSGDAGDIDLLCRRSTDQGRTWETVRTVWDDGPNTCGNPCPVVDRETGTIRLLMTWNRGDDPEPKIIAQQSRDTRRVFVADSTDDGLTWSAPREITAEAKRPDWTWYATGPGAGIQIERGPHRGRLVVPCDHIEAGTRHYYSHVIYSDDRGETWKLGGSTPRHQVNECEVVELTGDRLLLNMRNYDPARRTRQQAISEDGGLTWKEQRLVPELVEPICQASLRRYSWPEAGRPGVLLFANPAATRRERITVRASFDEGRSWPVARVLDPRPGAYSCLAVLPDGTIGLLYEAGEKGPYENLVFARFPLAWVTAGPAWETLPPVPDREGLAGAFAGVSGGALLVAGGANFPDRKPWEGGKKVWHDTVYVLEKPEGTWKAAGRLPRPLAYGVSASGPRGVVCVGGSDAERHHAATFVLVSADGAVRVEPGPDLPVSLAYGAGAVVGGKLYVCGGSEQPGERAAVNRLFVLDLAEPAARWEEREACPGRPRLLPAAASVDGAFHLLGGAALEESEGRTKRVYLRETWRYEAGRGWERRADLPRPSVGAPSPAPVSGSRCFLVGGDDGAQAGFEPVERHPGFSGDLWVYDAVRDAWSRGGELPAPRATLPTVWWRDRWVLPSGEVRPGVRSPEVRALRLE